MTKTVTEIKMKTEHKNVPKCKKSDANAAPE